MSSAPQSAKQQNAPEPGALSQPRMFRRSTGAHAILTSLLIADLVGILLTLLLGTLAAPLLWWLTRGALVLLHSSLLLTIGVVLSLGALLVGFASEGTTEKDNIWGCALVGIVIIGVILILFKVLSVPWLTIPVPLIPAPSLEAYTWLSPVSLYGAAVAAGLSLLAHLVVVFGYRKQAEQEHLSYSRAHPDGDAWATINSAYDHFRRGLARFDPPPIPTLKTPASFLYYDADAAISDPERKFYWHAGELILPNELISTEEERAKILLPYLARLLYDYHSMEIHQVELVLQGVRLARANGLTRLLLRLPLQVAVRSEARWAALEKERVLDRDRFAFWCGQGQRLRIQLVRQLQLREKHQEPDNALPSLAERIDHLRSLLRQDSRQVNRLRATLALDEPDANTTTLPPSSSTQDNSPSA